MGSISLTAVNAFGDQRVARQASAHLVDRGYPVVSASRLDEISVRNGLLAIVGAGHDHERMIAISAQLHDRIAALAVVGGPLAILLGRHEGLTMPTLVVSDRVGRRERRSAVRRLPRGSMLVRAANFDAALDAVVAFLHRTTESVPQRVGSRNLRPLALGLASAAFFAPAAGVLLAGSGADAAAAAVCTPADQGGGFLSITCDGEGGARLTLSATDDGVIKLNDEQVALLSETQKISILTTGGDDQLTIDESLRKFTTGPESTPIAFDVDMGAGQDELKWMGSPDNDSFKLTADAIDVPGGEEFENKALGVELLNFDLGDGDDTFDGGSWPLKIELDGGRGKDSLIGGLGEDVFKLSPGGDFLDGKEGFDLVKVATDESLLKITAETIELADSENIVEYKEMEALQYLGGAADSKIEINGFHFDKFDFDGGGGLDELKLTTGLPAVQLSGDKISLLDADQKLVGEIKYTDFDTFSYLGDALAAKIGLDDTVRFAKLDLDGGGGGDNIKLTSGDSLIGITDTAISLNFAKIEIDYKEFSELNLIGGAADSKIEINGFHFDKFDFDGGGGLDELKLTTGLPAVQLSGDKISLLDADQKLVGEIKYTDFDTFSYLGDALAAKIGLDDTVRFAKLDLDGGGGGDNIKLTSGDSLIGITDTAISLNFAKIEIDYKEFSELNLIGGAADSKIEINGFHFDKFDFDGGGGLDELKLTTGLPAVQLSGDKISLLDADQKLVGEIKYTDFDTFSYLGDALAAKIGLDDTVRFAKLDLDGGGGGDNIKLTSGDSLIGITDTAISLNFAKIEIDYKEFSELNLIGGAADSKIEINGFHFDKFDFDGGGGLDELKLTTGLPAVQLSGDKISLLDADQKLVGEIKYTDFDTFSYLGDALAAKIGLDDTVRFAKLDLDGGGGGDNIKLTSGDSLIGITDTAISLNFAKIEIDYKEFSELNLIGGAADSKIEINDFTGFAKLSLDGGGGLDDIKLSTGESLLNITETELAPGDLNRNPIEHTGFESLSVLAATDIANTFDGSKVETLKLTLDGGSKDDILFGGALDDLLTGGVGNNKISGGGGFDTLAEAVDANFVASNSTLAGAGLDAFSSIEALKLTGGAGDNYFNTEPFKGKVTLDGGAGNDLLISGQSADLLIGGLGSDSLFAGQGNDTLLAGEGDDTLNGGPGNDFGDGGPGIDTGKSIEKSVNIER